MEVLSFHSFFLLERELIIIMSWSDSGKEMTVVRDQLELETHLSRREVALPGPCQVWVVFGCGERLWELRKFLNAVVVAFGEGCPVVSLGDKVMFQSAAMKCSGVMGLVGMFEEEVDSLRVGLMVGQLLKKIFFFDSLFGR